MRVWKKMKSIKRNRKFFFRGFVVVVVVFQESYRELSRVRVNHAYATFQEKVKTRTTSYYWRILNITELRPLSLG
jgi:hypothetical protein